MLNYLNGRNIFIVMASGLMITSVIVVSHETLRGNEIGPSESVEYTIAWETGDDRSEHIRSKQAKFLIQKEDFIPYTKTIEWPEIKNISNPVVAEKIREILNFNKQIEFSKFDATSYNGITGIHFEVNYDQDDLLSLSFNVNTYGAYPDKYSFNQNVDVKTGNLIKIEDLTGKDKSDILTLLDQKLDVIKDSHPDDALVQTAKFTRKDLDNFKITDQGIEYNYDFGFPHMTQAAEPSGLIRLTWDELR